MHLRLPLFALLLTTQGLADPDARLTYLRKQLLTSKDARVRTQSAVILGASRLSGAAEPLCQALADREPVVRRAAADALAALGALALPQGRACLLQRGNDASPDVQEAVARALEAIKVPAMSEGGLYFALDPVADVSGGISADVLTFAEALMRERLVARHPAAFAPRGESHSSASGVLRARKMKGYTLRPRLSTQGGGRGLSLDILVMTYPDRSIQGSWSVRASGARPDELLKLMIPRVLEDAATDLEWKER